MHRFALKDNISHREMRRRIRAELDIERLYTKAPRLLAAINIFDTMMGLDFRHRGDDKDGTIKFISSEAEVLVRRDWDYPGVAYHVCLWSDDRRPFARINSARQLKQAVRRMLAEHEFHKHASLALAQALHHRLGDVAGVRILGVDLVQECLKWV
jgi:hypothetical protein